MKIIIAGAGEIGTFLAKMLTDGNHDITVIDTDEDKLLAISEQFDLLTVNGSATSISMLKQSQVERADLFIALMEEEAINIASAILSKKLGAQKTIARINSNEYLLDESLEYLTNLGIDSLIYPEILASREIATLLRLTGTTKAYDFCEGQLSVFVLKLDQAAPIINKTMMEAAKASEQTYRVIAITRNGETLIPRGQDIFKANDIIYVVSNKEGIKAMMKRTGKVNYSVKNIMIMGGSRIGQKTAYALQDNTNVKLLEVDKEKSFRIADELSQTLVINADGKNIDFLKSEGIQRTDAFIAVTGSTDTNILSCLLAKRLGVKRTIAEIENIDYIDLAENLGVDTIINKKRIAASHIFSFTIGSNVSSLQYLTGTDTEVLEFQVTPECKIINKPLKEIEFPKGAIVGGVVKNNHGEIATGNTIIEVGNKVVVFSLPGTIQHVLKLFK